MLLDRSKKVKKKLTLAGLFGIVTPHTEQHKQHMRTKTLLLTAALVAVGAASSMAQVYSQNAVGYINVTCGAGRYTMIAHQLTTGADRTIGTLIPTAATGTQFLYLGVGGFSTSLFDPDEGGWTNPGLTLDLGGGAYLFNPSASAQTFTFVGDVAQGTLSTGITVNNFLFRSSRVPQAGLLQTDLQFVPTGGDLIFKLSPTLS